MGRRRPHQIRARVRIGRYDDALPKTQGLAAYAERPAERLHCVEAIAKISDQYRGLDLTSASVRQAAAEATDAATLYQSDLAFDC